MQLRIPPVIVFMLALGMVFLCYYLFPSFNYKFELQVLLSRVFLASGAITGIIAVLTFRNHRTTVDPLHPEKASTLVDSGIYAYSRNPMYLAMALVLFGGVIRLGNPVGISGMLLFITYMTVFQIIPEEQVLLKQFGTTYQRYCSKVRRWM